MRLTIKFQGKKLTAAQLEALSFALHEGAVMHGALANDRVRASSLSALVRMGLLVHSVLHARDFVKDYVLSTEGREVAIRFVSERNSQQYGTPIGAEVSKLARYAQHAAPVCAQGVQS